MKKTINSYIKQLIIGLWTVYGHRPMAVIFFLGFCSGIPLALTASTLGVWLMEAGVRKETIGIFAAVATPYAFKFLWSPLVDGLKLPLFSHLGRRRGWLMVTQLLVIVALIALGASDPVRFPWYTALMALAVASASASYDIVVDAYRIEILHAEQYGAGAAMAVLGARIGMLVSSAGALYLATYFGWQLTYFIMAALLIVGVAVIVLSAEPSVHMTLPPHTLRQWVAEYVITPFADIMQRRGWLVILCFVVLFKLADAFMGVMTSPFFIDIGFSKEQIATVVKLYGLVATLAGSLVGGLLVARIGIVHTLWIGGIAQTVTNLFFAFLAGQGAHVSLLVLCVSADNFCGGLGTAAFVACLSRLCNARFTATQYALLSSLASFGRTLFSTPSGVVATQLGWVGFFIFSTALAIPGLILLAWLSRKHFLVASSA